MCYSFVVRCCNKLRRRFTLRNRFLGILCYNTSKFITKRDARLSFFHRKIIIALCKLLSIDVGISVTEASWIRWLQVFGYKACTISVIFINQVICHKWRQSARGSEKKLIAISRETMHSRYYRGLHLPLIPPLSSLTRFNYLSFVDWTWSRKLMFYFSDISKNYTETHICSEECRYGFITTSFVYIKYHYGI